MCVFACPTNNEVGFESVPKMHLAIIMDGNGRWAKTRGLGRIKGHKEGAKRVEEIVRYASKIGVHTLTLYAFSTENWQRPSPEVTALFQLIKVYLRRKVRELKVENVKINFIGRRDRLPKPVLKEMINSENETGTCTGLNLNVAVDYGGRDEILRVMNGLIKESRSHNGHFREIDEASFKSYSDLKNQCDPDLIIRTGGDKRLSNFMLWHAAYSELDFVDTLWPDFNEKELALALDRANGKERRYGGLGDS